MNPIKDFKAIIEELENLEDIKLYDEAKESNEPSILMDDAFKMIEAKQFLEGYADTDSIYDKN